MGEEGVEPSRLSTQNSKLCMAAITSSARILTTEILSLTVAIWTQHLEIFVQMIGIVSI